MWCLITHHQPPTAPFPEQVYVPRAAEPAQDEESDDSDDDDPPPSPIRRQPSRGTKKTPTEAEQKRAKEWAKRSKQTARKVKAKRKAVAKTKKVVAKAAKEAAKQAAVAAKAKELAARAAKEAADQAKEMAAGAAKEAADRANGMATSKVKRVIPVARWTRENEQKENQELKWTYGLYVCDNDSWPFPYVDKDLRTLVMRCMMDDPADRPEMAEIRRILDDKLSQDWGSDPTGDEGLFSDPPPPVSHKKEQLDEIRLAWESC
jgi:hypothetical protein